MASRTDEKNGSHQADARSDERDFKWAVEWLVRQQGQRRTSEILGVNRKTVALALRRERLTGRMNHAVQTLLANLDDPAKQEVMPLDRIESQINLLLESVDELDRSVEDLVRRVEALEDFQVLAHAHVEADGDSDREAEMHEDEMAESERQKDGPPEEPEPGQTGRQSGRWRR